MIYNYGFKIRGKSHEKDNTPCQDAYHIVKCRNDLVIAAVADGLGSCEHSDIASKMAVEKSVEYCKKNIPLLQSISEDGVCGIIRQSFAVATDAIEDKVAEDKDDLSQYFTTLSLAVLWNDTLYYGHAGDSGIIALTHEGRFEKVTEPQDDEEGGVIHLRFSDNWIFGQFDKKVCSVLLATDGILFYLIPILLRNEKVNVRVKTLRA
jgi:serine/threonine protein phosphatase PrpC